MENYSDACSNCGSPFEEGDLFCPNCGKQKISSIKKICEKCGTKLEDENQSCPICSQQVKEIENDIQSISLPDNNDLQQPTIQVQLNSEQSKLMNKKILKILIIAFSSIVGLALLISLLFTIFPSVDLNSNKFVKNWNALANESTKNITTGLVISNKAGSHSYDLGNGYTLSYFVVKPSLAVIGDLSNITYKKPNFLDSNTKKLVEDLVTIIGYKCDENALTESFMKSIADLIPNAVMGVKINYGSSGSLTVTSEYLYEKNYQESNVTGLNFGITIEDFIKTYNSNYAENNTPTYKNYASDDEYINCAKTLATESLIAPSTAVLQSATVLERDVYGRAIVLLELDSQNAFGAYIRCNYCIVIKGINYDDTFDYDTVNAVQTYTEYLKDSVIEITKKLNNFGEPQVDANVFAISNFSKTYSKGYIIYTKENTFNLYVDEKTAYVCCLEVLVNPNMFQDYTDEQISNIKALVSMSIASVTGLSKEYTSNNLDKCFDFQNGTSLDKYYENGVLYDSYVDGKIYLCVTAVSTSKYEYLKSDSIANKSSIKTLNELNKTVKGDSSNTNITNDDSNSNPESETISEKQLYGLCEPLAALYTVYADPTKGLNYTVGKVENKDAVTYLAYLGAMFYSGDAQEYDQLQKGVKYVSFPEIDVTQLLDVVYGNFFTTADILTDDNLLIFNGYAYYVPVLDTPKAEVKYIGGDLPLMTDTLNYSVKVDYNDGTVIEGTMKVKVAQSENNQYWMTITSISATDIKVVESAG